MIIEIADREQQTALMRRPTFRLAMTGAGVLLLGVVSSLALATDFSGNLVQAKGETTTESFATPTSAICEKVQNIAGVEVNGLAEFDVGQWKVRTYSSARTLGSVWFVNFEAACSDQVIDGLLTAEQIEGGYRILRMTPT